jgi:hypothetical protein
MSVAHQRLEDGVVVAEQGTPRRVVAAAWGRERLESRGRILVRQHQIEGQVHLVEVTTAHAHVSEETEQVR